MSQPLEGAKRDGMKGLVTGFGKVRLLVTGHLFIPDDGWFRELLVSQLSR